MSHSESSENGLMNIGVWPNVLRVIVAGHYYSLRSDLAGSSFYFSGEGVSVGPSFEV